MKGEKNRGFISMGLHMGDLYICEGTIDAEAYIEILEKHVL